MGIIKRLGINFTWLKKILFKKKTARIGIYGPPNAGKTTLANRILRDWTGDAMGSVSNIPHETRRARRREDVTILSNGSSVVLDIIDTPGLATKIDFHDFMAFGLSEEESKRRAKEATEGVIEAVKWLDELDGVLLVMDATEDPYTQVNVTVIGNMEARKLPLLIAANKVDLPNSSPSRIHSAFPQHPIVPISALEGQNIDLLYKEIAEHFG
ncbi:small GTP-binding protein domain [Candidatus Methanoperedens nitroreducens]|uniref:Small GTP-binding protein domain n=1 Tax=Candidatus Methanoperedens nitratireducens TaxID=1392998 RepID=A0A062UZI4_9EURY|nr:Era-like GTP-binding protein [Candidatus Methanoperedens nitroreducens]KCZ70572.1 small GTP-binding protein domain [Candidatus Methanoperedens nitroreducens]MDJ1420425.1 Era-like GTP-binding protein [Candidatus Methanoperedens sp.]